jgi:acetyl-CoA acetyltransferase
MGHGPQREWTAPFGALPAANWLAMPAQRFMHEFSLTREQLGWIALNARRNAGRNPDAVYRDPLTLADYLQARMISEPLCLMLGNLQRCPGVSG